MAHNFSSDKPVNSEIEDRFQRYNFSKRIAETIKNRENPDGIVIGIYGAWGEGKTSVLNFIEEELKTINSIITIKLNPWRYSDEDSLLKGFFLKIAQSLGHELENKKEKFGSLISKYGGIANVFGYNITDIGKSLAEVDLEILKNRIDEFLNESTSKLVIFVDDIDRLDKQEIYSLFRLVKLTADFSKTTYILSFDETMVASAIGSRFGDGDQKSGFNFLEKIIQVPLKLPQAQLDSLKTYCFELVDKALTESNLEISKDDAQRFVSEFTSSILSRLKTPRLAVRYGNSLSFSLPLLKGEVNHVDLMLIEALKIFYPKHYDFIKDNSHYFISSYSSFNSYGNSVNLNNNKRKEELSSFLETLGIGLSNNEKTSILALLKELFPTLKEAFDNTIEYEGYKKWYKHKRIVSPNYFKRYFSFVVLKGEISDNYFDNFKDTLHKLSTEEITDKIQEFIKESSASTFLYKINNLEEDFTWEESKKVSLSIAYIGEIFPENNSMFSFGMKGAKSQAAIFIYQLLKRHNDYNERFEFAKNLMISPVPIDFAYELNNWFRTGESTNEKTFSDEDFLELGRIFKERAINEAGDIPLFDKFPNQFKYIFKVWKAINKGELENYLTKIFNSDPKRILDLLRAITPTAQSTSYPDPYKSNFTQEDYNFLKSFINEEYVHNMIIGEFSHILNLDSVKFFNFENSQTDINILRQFEHWYDLEKQDTLTAE